MRSALALVSMAFALSFAGAGCADLLGEKSEGSKIRARVVWIADGDTLTLRGGRRVRLVQIDAPEQDGGECYSGRAETVLRELVRIGSLVVVETDPHLDSHDEYGRTLGYVFRGTMNVNLELVRLGAASARFYHGERGRYADELLAAAREARASGAGLWGACPGTPLDPYHPVDSG
jgi:micrococcal nuclease